VWQLAALAEAVNGFAIDAQERGGLARGHEFAEKPRSTHANRRMRLKQLMKQHRGNVSDSDLNVVEETGDFVLAIHDKLNAAAHSRSAPIHAEVRESLEIAEKMLRRLLVQRSTAT
jgi:hypothetical protein